MADFHFRRVKILGSRMPKGTEMRPYLKQLSEEDRGEYIDDFVKRIKEIYSVQKNGSIILKYPRLFFTAKRV